MILDAGILTTFQACRREHLLRSSYTPLKWRAKSLFDHALRRAIFSVSNADDPVRCASDASAYFMQQAADPGLDLPTGNPYVMAKDYCAMLETIIRSLAKLALLTVKPVSPVKLSPTVEWQVRSWADDSGTLHRWITVDDWSDADFYREMHGWWTAGDQAATGAGMTLHVVEIGQVRKVANRVAQNGKGIYRTGQMRRASPWARGWRHPAIPQIQALRFKRREGQNFSGWDPIYLADSRMDPEDWVQAMWKEGAAQALVHHLTINPLPHDAREAAREQVLAEAEAMQALAGKDWRGMPMSRGACDGLVPCRFQECCYAVKPVDPATLGLYRVRKETSQLISIDCG